MENKHSYTDILKRVQHILIDITTNISTSNLNSNRTQFLSSRHTKELDEWIEEYSEKLTPVHHYIIPVSIFFFFFLKNIIIFEEIFSLERDGQVEFVVEK